MSGVGVDRREHWLYALGAIGVAVHTVDHLVSEPEWGFLFTSALLLSIVTALLALVYPWVPPWARAAADLPLGLMWVLTAGVHHVGGLLSGGPSPTDYTGVATAIGGVLIVVAGRQAWAAS